MEAMETQAIHVTKTKTLSSSLISSNTKKCIDNDEITPELEDQLLNDNMSEDQVLEDEDDAQSEGSIRLRYSDVEADDDENTDKISGASSGPAINNQKKVNSDTVNESSGFEINGSMPVYTNLNHINEIDFTEDDTLSGINFCDNNDDDENGLIPVKDIIDKTITLNQFSQSAYDNSWRLSGKSPRYRHRNYHNFLRLSNFNQLQNNLNIPYDIGENCEPLKNSDNENINLNDKKVYSNNKNKTSLFSSLPPPSPPPAPAPAPLSSSPSPSKFMTKIFPPSSMIDNDDNLIIESKNDKIAEKLDKKLNDEIKNNTSNVNIIEKNNKITDKDSGEGTDESTDSLQFELPKKQINGILDNKLELNNENIDSTEISSVNNDENNEIITNSVKNSDVIENIVNNKNENTEIEAAKTSDTITDESSDSGFVSSTSTSVTGNDEILKDNSDELIKDKIIDNEEPPVLTPEITIEKEEEENINNKVDEIIESDNKLKITETNENIDKENSMIIDEEPTTSIVSNDNNDSTKKSEESIVDDNTKLIESMDIVTIDDCSEITIGPITEKIEEEKNNDIDLKINNDNEKLDKTVDDQESIDTSSHEILVINEEQVDSTDESTKQICSKRKRKSVKTIGDTLDPEKENLRLRVKRETAQKAEELIRKDSQMINEDSDSDDFDIINKNDIKLKNSPTSLKRTNENNDIIDNKRLKIDPKIEIKTETYITNRKIKPYVNLRKILLRDSKEKLANMRQEDLEELLIQKIIESITMRDEIGKLREQAKLSERAKELSQQKCASLAKQIKDFEMIINRYAIDREKNPGIYIPPTKINRSVGLQVNFLTDRGVQNLRQVNKLSQQNTSTNNNNNNNNSNNNNKTHNVNNNYSNNNHNNNTNYNHVNINSVNNNINNNNNRLINNSTAQVIVGGNASGNNIINSITPSIHNDDNPNSQLRKGIKIRSPRRGGDVHPQVIANIQNQLPNQMHLINSVTSPIVAPKINDTRISIASTNSSTITPNTMSNSSIIVNGNSPNIQYRQTRNTNTNINNTQNRTNNNGDNLIDLTEEEEKTKILSSPPALTALVTPVTTSTHLPKNQQRQTRMISNSSSHVTIAQPNVRVVTGQGQTTTGIVNGQRLIFMHPGGTPPRQLILTSTASTSRTTVVTPSSSPRSSYINIAPSGTTPITKSSPVRVLPTPNPPVQLVKVNHPAPLPVIPTHAHNPSWKMPPPAPSLKISKVTHGIVLSWNMILSDKCADIASYQLFAYQEISTTPPSSSLWKKVGDVRALPLPMACTLTQFLEGNNYYFAVRAVDCHGRLGEFSLPGNITL